MRMPWVIASVVLALSAVIAWVWMSWIATAPLNEPVSVSEPFTLQRPIALRLSDRYFLELQFDRRDASFERLRSLVGGAHGQKIEVNGQLVDAGEPPGIQIPVEWSLKDSKGVLVASGRSNSLGGNSYSSSEIGRLLHQGDFEAGQYTFSAALPKGITDFRGIRAYLRLSVEPKNSHSRTMGVYWLATIFIPVAIVASLGTGIVGLWAWLR